MFQLSPSMIRLIEENLGLPIDQIRKMSAANLDLHIAEKLGRPLRFSSSEDVDVRLRKMLRHELRDNSKNWLKRLFKR